MDPQDLKQEIRNQVRARRAKSSHSASEVTNLHKNLINGIRENIQVIAGYVELPHEPPVLEALDQLYRKGYKILLPKLGLHLERAWAFYEGKDSLDYCAPGRPIEPVGEVLEESALVRADMVFVPALAIDKYGHRIGQGGGWYDRALRYAKPSIPKVAVLWENEVSNEELLFEEHDVCMSHLLTPSGLYNLPITHS